MGSGNILAIARGNDAAGREHGTAADLGEKSYLTPFFGPDRVTRRRDEKCYLTPFLREDAE
jgi:hypothetical protein